MPATFSASATVTNTALKDIAVASTAVDSLIFNGRASADTFRWFAQSTAVSNSIIRCVSDKAFDGTETVQVTLDNGSVTADGTYDVSKATTEGSFEYILAAADVAAATGNTDRVDVDSINFVASGAGSIVCDRLIQNTTSGTVTPFGNKDK